MPTQRTGDTSLLHRGVSSYQIFSDGKFVFKMTDTYETLIRYRFYNEGTTNTVEETVIYKRVPSNDSRILELSKANHHRKPGHTERFVNGVRYDIYALFSSITYLNDKARLKGFKGYRVVSRQRFGGPQPLDTLLPTDGLYFVYEQKGVK